MRKRHLLLRGHRDLVCEGEQWTMDKERAKSGHTAKGKIREARRPSERDKKKNKMQNLTT